MKQENCNGSVLITKPTELNGNAFLQRCEKAIYKVNMIFQILNQRL